MILKWKEGGKEGRECLEICVSDEILTSVLLVVSSFCVCHFLVFVCLCMVHDSCAINTNYQRDTADKAVYRTNIPPPRQHMYKHTVSGDTFCPNNTCIMTCTMTVIDCL